MENKTIGIFGAIGRDDMGDDALLLSNVDSLIKHNYKVIIFTYNISKTINLLISNNLLPTNGISENIKIVKALDYFDRKKIIEYIDTIIDTFLEKIFKKRLNILQTIYKGFIHYKLILNINGYLPINQYLREYLNIIKECSLLLFIGGGYMNKYWGQGIYQFIISLSIGKEFNIPCIASGQTFGPLDAIQKKIVKKHIKKLDYISTRDINRSKQRLIELEYDQNKIVEGPDDAIFLTNDIKAENHTPQYNKHFIVVANFGLFLKYSKYPLEYLHTILAQFFDYIAESKNGIILNISMTTGSQDITQGLSIQNKMKYKDRFHFVPLYTELREIKSIIGSSNLVVSSRLHPVVFAISEKKPFIGISSGGEYYDSKLKGISEIYDYDPRNHIINADDLAVDILLEYCTRALNDKYDNDSIYEMNEKKRKDFLEKIQKMIEEEG